MQFKAIWNRQDETTERTKQWIVKETRTLPNASQVLSIIDEMVCNFYISSLTILFMIGRFIAKTQHINAMMPFTPGFIRLSFPLHPHHRQIQPTINLLHWS